MSQRRCWIRSHEDGCHFGSNVFSASPPAPFIYTCASKSTPCVFICALPQKTPVAPPQSLPISDAVAAPASSRLCPGTPDSAAPPRLGGGLVLLLTGVICASGIDVVCQPIKIFEGNVYFLERIAPAAWKLFLNKAIYA